MNILEFMRLMESELDEIENSVNKMANDAI